MNLRDIHTVKEWLRVSDMVRTAEVIVEMFRLHYPNFFPGDGGPVGGDFAREAMNEQTGKD